MARLKVPALYQLDVGSSEWSWHKMEDLILSVRVIFDHSLSDLPYALQASTQPLSAKWLLDRYGHLNKQKLFGWSDDKDIDFVPVDQVPFDKKDLYIPALWSMRVLDAVKEEVEGYQLTGELTLYRLFSSMLGYKETTVMKLRLGLFGYRKHTDREIGESLNMKTVRVRQIRSKALRIMRKAYDS